MSMALILITSFPSQADNHKILTMVLVLSALASFVSLIIFWIIVATIVLKRGKNNAYFES